MKSPRRLLGCPEGCPRIGFSSSLTPFRGRVLFAGWDPAHGRELWSTDGTGEGTRRLQDLCAGPCDGLPDLPLRSHPLRDRLVLTDLQDGAWATDGTAAGTRMVADLWPGPLAAHPQRMVTAGGKLFFIADDGEHGRERWALPLP